MSANEGVHMGSYTIGFSKSSVDPVYDFSMQSVEVDVFNVLFLTCDSIRSKKICFLTL